MPEKELSQEEKKSVRDWLKFSKARWFKSFKDDIISSGVYIIEGEPVVLLGERVGLPAPDPGVRYHLICSDQHAKQLEDEGWLSFSRTIKTRSNILKFKILIK